MIIDNIQRGFPVLYASASLAVKDYAECGHAYVCDGYNENTDMFHFNWGYDGEANGWYSLDDSGDIAVIDKSLEPAHGDIVVSYINEEFNIKQLDLTHKDEGYIELRSGNPKYPTFRINEDDHFQVWGVAVYTIKKWK